MTFELPATLAVVPILPTLPSLAALLLAGLAALAAAVASLRRPAVARTVLRLLWRQKLSLLLLAGMGSALVALTGWTLGRLCSTPVPAEHRNADWRLHRGGITRRGWASDGEGPRAGRVVWTAGRPGEAFYASPAVVGSRVYCVGSRGNGAAIDCRDAESGQRVWSAAPPGYRATFCSPVVAGDVLVCGEGLHHTTLARVVCLDLRPGREGRLLWSFQTNSHVEATPCLADGIACVAAGDDGIYALRLDADLPATERILWHAPGDRFPDAESSPVVFDGRVYAGLGEGGNAVCVLDAATGRELARIAMPYPVFSPPSISGGKLYVGMGRGNYVEATTDPAGRVCCIDLATLTIEWAFDVGGTVLGAVVVAGDRLIFGSADGHVYALDRAGRLLRTWNGHSPIIASPAVTGDCAYVVARSGVLTALDLQWLEPVWECRVASPGLNVSSPVVARGHVYVGTAQDGLVCAGERAERAATDLWPGHLGGPGAAGCRDGSRLPRTPAVRWQVATLPDTASASFDVTAPVAAVARHVVAAVSCEDQPVLMGLALNEDGSIAHGGGWFLPTRQPIVTSPAIAGGVALAVEGSPDDQVRRLLAVDLRIGSLAAARPVSRGASGIFSVDANRIVIQDEPGVLSAHTLDLKRLWQTHVGELRHPPHLAASLVVVAATAVPQMIVLDGPTGRELWRVSLPAEPVTSPVVIEDRLIIGAESRVEARSLIDGRLVWSEPSIVGAEGTLAVDPERTTFLDATGDVVVLETASGRLLSRHGPADSTSGLLVSRSDLLFTLGGRLLRLDRHSSNGADRDSAANTASPWFVPVNAGRRTTPAILADGRVYIGIDGQGLVSLAEKDAR